MIDNFYSLKYLCDFSPSTYYKFVLLTRDKDHGSLQLVDKDKKELLGKQWLVEDQDYLNKVIPDMKNFANAVGGRIYMCLDRMSYIKTLFTLQEETFKMIRTYQESSNNVRIKHLNKLWNSVTSKELSTTKESRRFMLDVDVKDLELLKRLEDKQKSSHIATLETVNGFHIIFKRNFNPAILEIEKENNVEIKTCCLGLIYKGS
jgi:hypothetical protein